VQEFIGTHDKRPDEPPKPGTIRVFVPEINNLLPVYVFDRYDGFDVKIIPEKSGRHSIFCTPMDIGIRRCAAGLGSNNAVFPLKSFPGTGFQSDC
jgi:hypothetical protein